MKGKLRNMADINIQVRLQADNATKGADKLKKSLDRTEKSAKSLGISIKNSSSAIKIFAGNIAAIGFAGLVKGIASAVTGITKFGFASVQAASDAEETLQKFNVVFQEVGKEADIVADNLAKNFGLAGSEAKALLSNTGDLLAGFGFTAEAALDISEQVQKLAVDLSSFSNSSGGATGASAALTKALLGERESLKTLGISIQEVDVVRQVAVNTANGLTFATERQAKAQATLDLALKQSGNAIGDFARSSSSLANLQKTLAARFQSLQESLGKELLPIFKAVTATVIRFVEKLQASGDAVSFVQQAAEKLPAALAAISDGFVFINNTIQGTRIFLDLISAGFNILVNSAVNAAIKLNEVEIAIKQLLGVDTTNLEEQNVVLRELAKETENTANAALESAAKIDDSRVRTNSIIKKTGAEIIKTLKEETEVATNSANLKAAADKKAADAAKARAAELIAIQKDKAAKELVIREEELAANDAFFLAKEEAALSEDGVITAREQLQLDTLADQRATAAENEILAKKKLVLDTRNFEIAKTKVKTDQTARRTKLAIQETNVERDENKKKIKAQAKFFSDLTVSSKLGGEKVFKVAKGLQLANATIAGITAIQMAASAIPFPGNIPGILEETARAVGSVSAIKSQSPSFQDGGVVPGNSFSGDNVQANVNSGEVILNQQQQAETLFAISNGAGGGSGGREIVVNTSVQLDGTEIARAVSREVADGAVLGEFE